MHVFPQASDGLPKSYPRVKYKYSLQEIAFLVNKLNIFLGKIQQEMIILTFTNIQNFNK